MGFEKIMRPGGVTLWRELFTRAASAEDGPRTARVNNSRHTKRIYFSKTVIRLVSTVTNKSLLRGSSSKLGEAVFVEGRERPEMFSVPFAEDVDFAPAAQGQHRPSGFETRRELQLPAFGV